MKSPLIGLAVVSLIAAFSLMSCRHQIVDPGPVKDTSALSSLQGFTHAHVSLVGVNLFTTDYMGSYDTSRNHTDTITPWTATTMRACAWHRNVLLESYSVVDSNNGWCPVSIIDSSRITLATDGKSIQDFSFYSYEADSDGRADPMTSAYSITGGALPLVSSTKDSVVFAVSGTQVRQYLRNAYSHYFDNRPCSIDWYTTDYDSTQWNNTSVTPSLTVVLTR